MNKGICIFGGSFDPVHKGHKKLALFICKTLFLKKMLIIPAALSPFKNTSGASAEDRMKMCSLCFNEDIFEVSDIEISRGGKSYTVDTVKAVKELYPDEKLYLLIGSDQLLSFNKWYKFEEILENVTLVAVSRENGEKKKEMEEFAEKNLAPFGKYLILDFEPFIVSSTEIRKKAAENENIDFFVEKEVAEYILSEGLYKNE